MNEAMPTQMQASNLVAAIIHGVVGAFMMFMTPAFITLFALQAGLDDRQIGWVAASEINAMAITMGVAAFLLSRFNWRHIVGVGLLLMAAGNAATAAASSFELMLWVRALTGLGAGFVVGASFAAIGQWRNPDWAFAVYLVAGAVFAASVLWFFPWFQAHVSPGVMFLCVAAIAAASLACLPWLPARSLHAAAPGAGAAKIDVRLAIAGLLGVFVYFMAPGAVWGYFERIGAASAVSPDAIGAALSGASVAGIVGAFAVTVLPRAWGRAWPLAVGGAVALTSIFLLWGQVSAPRLILAGALFMGSWQFAQPLFSGFCCDADARGRVVSGMGGIQTIGYGLGPAMSALLLRNGDFSPVLLASAGAVVVGSLIVILGGRARVAPLAGGASSVGAG